MEKVMNIGGKDVKFDLSFSWAFIYQRQFGSDPMPLISRAAKILSKTTSKDADMTDIALQCMDALGMIGIIDIAWALAKNADKTIPTPEKWVGQFGDDFSPIGIITDLITDVVISCISTKNRSTPSKEPETAGETETSR